MRRSFFLFAGLVVLVGTATLFAQNIEADPNKDYHISPEPGAWMICAASFAGPTAPQLAHDLVLEIRQAFGLPAYLFDRSQEERLKQQEQIRQFRERWPQATRVRSTRVEEQYAVLVGGYPSMDAARKELDRIRQLKPSAKFMDTVSVDDCKKLERAAISPFLNAFVAHNPSVPTEKPNDDPMEYSFLKRLNAGESYSLLSCRKPVTLLVKSFQGAYVVQPQNKSNGFLDLIGLGSRSGEVLGAGGLQAHGLADYLRHVKETRIEAYVLHTRNYSFVSVGGFDSADDPKLKETQQIVSRLRLNGLGPHMQLFAQPLPMEVPKPK